MSAIVTRNLHRALTAAAPAVILLVVRSQSGLANVTISSAQTQNMACSGSICAPTANDATLNVNDLENLLASGNIEITTTGAGVQADDIIVDAALSWPSANSLALDAYESILIEQTISITGLSGLSVTTDDGGSNGSLSFGAGASVTFSNLGSTLAINGKAYTLVGDIATLAGDIAANPSGNYALANDYDAAADGTYTVSPVTTTLAGVFEGLGHTISNVTISNGRAVRVNIGGLFAETGGGSTVNDVSMASVSIECSRAASEGGLVGLNYGNMSGDHASGVVKGNLSGDVGGLVGESQLTGNGIGTIVNSSATTTVEELHTGHNLIVALGGLVGWNGGNIDQSFATGAVTGAARTGVGGLVGTNNAVQDENLGISNSYSTGSVSGGNDGIIGGLAGANVMYISTSYSTGKVSGSHVSDIGGFIGLNEAGDSVSYSYWDTTTNKKVNGVGEGGSNGITGLTTKQLRSGLPAGFDPAIWTETQGVNNGFPYLIANPPE